MTEQTMTPTEAAALAVMQAAKEIGLDPVAELAEDGQPWTVDVREVRDGRVVGAVRLILREGAWWAEHPARPAGRDAHAPRTRLLIPSGEPVTAGQVEAVDYWLAQVPRSGRTCARVSAPGRDPMAWARPGYWEARGVRLGRSLARH